MALNDDLAREALTPLLGERAARTFPAMVSTDSEAAAWARAGAPHGAVVTAGYVAAPRGRSGLDWDAHTADRTNLACSVVLRAELPEEREGWPYVPATLALCDVLDGARPAWPDQVVDADGTPLAAVGVQSESVGGRLRWVVLTVLVFGVEPPRGPLLARLLERLDVWMDAPTDEALAAVRDASTVLGRRVSASLLPMGPESPSVVGEAVDIAADGGLVVADDRGARMVVLPQALGRLTDPGEGPVGPPGVG